MTSIPDQIETTEQRQLLNASCLEDQPSFPTQTAPRLFFATQPGARPHPTQEPGVDPRPAPSISIPAGIESEESSEQGHCGHAALLHRTPAVSQFASGMVSGEIPERESNTRASKLGASRILVDSGESEGSSALTCLNSLVIPHETPDAPSSTPSTPQPAAAALNQKSAHRFASKAALWRAYESLAAKGYSANQAARELGVSNATLSRMAARVRADGLGGLADNYHKSGRKPALTLTPEEEQRLQSIFLRTNRNAEGGSMQTACKFFALDPQTREELRTVILSALDKGHLPRFALKVLKQITRAHFAAHRKPGMLATQHFSGRRGSFARDKFERRRVIESDDATLNFPAWIPWPQGGDPVSDKYGVKLGRWQFLPALEAGWSHYYVGYSLVARPRGSYRIEDVKSIISMVAHAAGLPDEFRFERGTWEANDIVELLGRLGVTLNNVYQSNQKPFIEGGFSPLWTYLSIIDGQVGRFRGEMEKANLDVERCRAGRLDPRQAFPSLQQCVKALDGALAMRNSDKIKSHYGEWIPEVRFREHKTERPWTPLDAALEYLFSPVVKEWTVAKGTVGNTVALTDDVKAPFYFWQEDLWRSNGHKVRVYFDPAATPCVGTIVCAQPHLCFKPGDVICQAELTGEIPHFTRAALGWADPTASSAKPSQRGPLSAVRREVRALVPGGRAQRVASEERDGAGSVSRIAVSSADCVKPTSDNARCLNQNGIRERQPISAARTEDLDALLPSSRETNPARMRSIELIDATEPAAAVTRTIELL